MLKQIKSVENVALANELPRILTSALEAWADSRGFVKVDNRLLSHSRPCRLPFSLVLYF